MYCRNSSKFLLFDHVVSRSACFTSAEKSQVAHVSCNAANERTPAETPPAPRFSNFQLRLIPLTPVSLHLVLCRALEAAIFRCGIHEGGRVWPGKKARRALSGGIRRGDRRSRDRWPARGRGRSPGAGRRRYACGVVGSNVSVRLSRSDGVMECLLVD